MNSMAGVGAGDDTETLRMKRIPGCSVQDDEAEEFSNIY